MADLNGINMGFIPEALKNKIDAIKGMEGDAAKVDGLKEFDALAELLANTSGTEQKKYIEAHMQEYENFVQEQQEKDFLSRVSDRAKEFVKQVAKMFGDGEKIDEKAEARMLKDALNDDRYSDDDKKYIARALQESDVCCDGEGGFGGENTPKAEPKSEPKTEPKSPAPRPTPKAEPKSEPKTEPKETEPTKPKPWDKSWPDIPESEPLPDESRVPDSKSEPKSIEIKEKDRTEGQKLGKDLADEIDSGWVDNKKVAKLLTNVNSNNAYHFFKAYNDKLGKEGTIITNILNDTSDINNNLTLQNLNGPINSLINQAEEIGLKDNPAYVKLVEAHGTAMDRAKWFNHGDLSRLDSLKLDSAIKALLREMEPYVQ